MTRRLCLSGMRKRYDGSFKARVALEAIRGDRTVAEMAAAYGVHPNQNSKWKKQALDELPKIFSDIIAITVSAISGRQQC